MTAQDLKELSELLDEKLAPISARVESHDHDIRAVKAVIGFLVALGAFVVVIAGAIQGWFAFVDHVGHVEQLGKK